VYDPVEYLIKAIKQVFLYALTKLITKALLGRKFLKISIETTECRVLEPPFQRLTLLPYILIPRKFFKPLFKNLNFLLFNIKDDKVVLFLNPAEVLAFLFKNIN
jgi:hypothetical protein